MNDKIGKTVFLKTDIEKVDFSNPFIIKDNTLTSSEIHDKVITNYKSIDNLLRWFFSNHQVTSSRGYHHYSRSTRLHAYDVEQHIIFSVSWIMKDGLFVGYKYSISFNEFSANQGGIARSGSLDDLENFLRTLIEINNMVTAGEDDKTLAWGILTNNFINNG
jgi:hypothetical protein